MAWPGCLLLLLLHTGLPQPGHSFPPSTLQCHIPHDTPVLYCSWDSGLDPLIPTNYTMHWESQDGTLDSVEATNVSGVILRDQYNDHSDLRVWFTAVNQQGNITSEVVEFNTGDIIKPPTPEIYNHSLKPLEIYWKLECYSLLGRHNGDCEVRYRNQDQQDWTQERNLLNNFLPRTPEPFTVYEFQVRCACQNSPETCQDCPETCQDCPETCQDCPETCQDCPETCLDCPETCLDCPETVNSDWSLTYTAQSDEAAPVKALDVWSDCGLTTELSQCLLMWKELPAKFARGKVVRYEVTLLYSDGTPGFETIPVVNLDSRGKIWRFNLRAGVLEVAVSAHNSKGASEPARLALPTSSKGALVSELSCIVNRTDLNASWFLPNQYIESIQEYVVQYNKAGHFQTTGFDWIKVEKDQLSVILRGAFNECTAYNVSLFAVLNNSSCLLASKIAYSVHGLPPKVRNVTSDIKEKTVTVSWQHNFLNESKGHVLYYQLVLDNSTVHNVSGNQRSFVFEGLTSGDHQVWIRAATEAGLGPSEPTNFKFNPGSFSPFSMWTKTVLFLVTFFVTLIVFRGMYKWCILQKVPDAMNSKLFLQNLSQLDSPWPECPASVGSNPKISKLEVLEKPPRDAKSSPRKMSNSDRVLEERTRTRSAEEQDEEKHVGLRDYGEKDLLQTRGRRESRKEGYSIMTDNYEDEGGGEESLSEDDQFVSDYEKHYMPGHV
ncbi:hypothetical protein DPEC_G00307960 [Dallia pectoralis]|uniref:Uncharacterized protein n=1 Tax=Dallia pectoralis TaxID=75939 RepID=A0ACC2FEJ1_DALPE|nr:hypothetical protein DPEC_G00307960 [Dallia pectoralis]